MHKLGVQNYKRDMTIEDFKQKIDEMFPCKLEE